jgi:hypothetical protein
MAHSASKLAQRLAKTIHLMIWTVISFLSEIFRRLNAVFTPFYTLNVSHGTFCFETRPAACETHPFDDFDCNFLPVGDISTFKRCFYSILIAECNARHFLLRNKHSGLAKLIHLTIFIVISFLLGAV